MITKAAACCLPFIAVAFVLATPARADLPLPGITRADPNPVYPGVTRTDSNGRVEIVFYGHDLGPDDGDNGHPAGWRGGYQHIFIRTVSADNRAGNWAECQGDLCMPYGSTGVGRDRLDLGLAPALLSQPGSHLQIKLWVSLGADGASNPEQATNQASGWSPIYTVDVAGSGQAEAAPVVLKMSPSEIGIDGASSNWYIRLIGTGLCKGTSQIVFNGDMASALSVYPDRCGTVGPDYPHGTQLYDVELPEALRKPGVVTVMVHGEGGDSAINSVTIKQIMHRLNGPNVRMPNVATPVPQSTQNQAQPPIRRKP